MRLHYKAFFKSMASKLGWYLDKLTLAPFILWKVA